jgi:hypothetical protein
MIKKIIFLDIDGVLNYMPDRQSLETLKNNLGHEKFLHEIYGFSKRLVKYLKMIIDDTNCKIVFSTSWRYFKDHHIEGSDWRKTLAELLNVDQTIFIGNTPDISSGWDNGSFSRRRGSEIKMWLECNTEPGKIKFCIIDDEIGDIIPIIPKKYVVHTDMKVGLTLDDVKKAIQILNI